MQGSTDKKVRVRNEPGGRRRHHLYKSLTQAENKSIFFANHYFVVRLCGPPLYCKMAAIIESEVSMEKIPDLEIAQKRFLLSLPAHIVPSAEKESLKRSILDAIEKDSKHYATFFLPLTSDHLDMLPLYTFFTEHYKWPQ